MDTWEWCLWWNLLHMLISWTDSLSQNVLMKRGIVAHVLIEKAFYMGTWQPCENPQKASWNRTITINRYTFFSVEPSITKPFMTVQSEFIYIYVLPSFLFSSVFSHTLWVRNRGPAESLVWQNVIMWFWKEPRGCHKNNITRIVDLFKRWHKMAAALCS